MKKFLLVIMVFALAFVSKAQSITSVTPSEGTVITFLDNAHARIVAKATVSNPGLYAIAFYVDPVGKQRVLQGKNKNLAAAITFWGQPIVEDGEVVGYTYEVPLIIDGITKGDHTLRVETYSTGFKVIESVDTKFVIHIP